MSFCIHDWRYQTRKFLENFGQTGHWKKRRVCAKCGKKQCRGTEKDSDRWFDSLFAVLQHGYPVNLKNEDEWSREERHGQYDPPNEPNVWTDNYYKSLENDRK